ncbi:MAG: decaprenyl-phosphate phosphoribosyltransferase [Betaproteobacteria bacterium]|nr:decaprenyl-phosphate phosphoribosyltransferase [Betaproteobacteria bacterium]
MKRAAPAGTVAARAAALWRLMRPYQWVKNGFVLAGLIFGHGWSDSELVGRVLLLFAGFCLVSSGVYMLNDILDREADRVHPEKRERPVARGDVGVRLALACAAALVVAGLACAAVVSAPAAGIAAAYIVLNMGYSAGLKHIAILDVFLIAGGFMLRIAAGTLGVGIEPSRWLLGCGLMFTLFLGFCKRRAELASLDTGAGAGAGDGVGEESTVSQRRSLQDYSPALLDPLIWICAAGAALGYALYTLDERTVITHGTAQLIWTLPLVLYGLFRYLYALYARGAGADPASDLFRDPHLLVALAGWLGLSWWLIS